MRAEHDGLALLTTEKDRARMAGEPLLAALAARAHVLPVTLVVDEADELRRAGAGKCVVNDRHARLDAGRSTPTSARRGWHRKSGLPDFSIIVCRKSGTPDLR